MKPQTTIDFEKTRAAQAKAVESIRNQALPPYITITEPGDTDIGQLYHPVNLDGLMGAAIPGSVQRSYTVVEILHALEPGDRAEVKKAIKKGYSPVLFVDLLSGAGAIEMRKYTQPSPEVQRLWDEGADSTTMCFKQLTPKKAVREIPVAGTTKA